MVASCPRRAALLARAAVGDYVDASPASWRRGPAARSVSPRCRRSAPLDPAHNAAPVTCKRASAVFVEPSAASAGYGHRSLRRPPAGPTASAVGARHALCRSTGGAISRDSGNLPRPAISHQHHPRGFGTCGTTLSIRNGADRSRPPNGRSARRLGNPRRTASATWWAGRGVI